MVNFRAAMEESPQPAGFVAPVDPFDLERVKARFAIYKPDLEAMVKKAKEIVVKDQESLTLAVEMAAQAKRFWKKIYSERKAITEKHRAFVDGTNTLARMFEPLADIEKVILKPKINAYQVEQDRIRREQERKAREEAEALKKKLDEEARKEQERLNAEAKAKGTEPVQVAPVQVPEIIMPPAKTITRTEEGSANLRRDWKWKIVDFSKLPDEYKVENRVKLNQAVAGGLREIAGCEIYEQPTTVIRA